MQNRYLPRLEYVQKFNLYVNLIWMAKENNPVVFISAFKKINFNELRDQIELMLSNIKPPAKPDLYFGFENKSV